MLNAWNIYYHKNDMSVSASLKRLARCVQSHVSFSLYLSLSLFRYSCFSFLAVQMNKCILVHIWCSSKSVSECVRKIIIYHIIFCLFYGEKISCVFFPCTFRLFIIICGSQNLQKPHRENVFEWSSSGETRYRENNELSRNDTHTECINAMHKTRSHSVKQITPNTVCL